MDNAVTVFLKKFKNHTLKEYLDVLSKKTPVPGGGSAAALVAAAGVALLSMVASYSKGKCRTKAVENKIKKIHQQTEAMRKRLLELVDLDAKAYEKVVKARKKPASARKKALKEAGRVPLEVCRLCYKAVGLASYLAKNGNKNLIDGGITDYLIFVFLFPRPRDKFIKCALVKISK